MHSMSEPYEINLTESAETDLRWFTAYAQRIILDGIEVHLRHQPAQGSRKIVELRPNPIASWELRLGDYRVLYNVNEAEHSVTVDTIGEKHGNRLIVQGTEFTDHESN
jgi:mRNA-degrading endonuclease RelE of RelBE toxin-antitoxin system